MRNENGTYRRACVIAISVIWLNTVGWAAEGKPQTAKYVNYVAELNKLGMADRSENLNAAPFYQKAAELYIEKTEDQRNLVLKKGWPADFPAGEQQLLREWVQSNSQALSQLELGSKKPYCWLQLSSVHDGSPVDGTLMAVLPGWTEYRYLGQAITVRARFSAAEGNIDKALTDVVTCYCCGMHRQVGGPKILVEQLVGIAVRGFAVQAAFDILDRTKPTKDLLAALQRQMEWLSTNESYILDFRAEKLTLLDIIQRIFTDDGKGDGQIDLPAANEILPTAFDMVMPQGAGGVHGVPFESLMRGLRRRQTTETEEKLYKYLELASRKSPWQWKAENVEQEIQKIAKENALVGMFCPLSPRIVQLFSRCRADTDGLITTLALLRYKADKGQFPEKLDELVSAGYLKILRSDPFSGKPFGGNPFAYKRVGEDFVLYSFGTNLKDDGGKLGLTKKGQPTRWADDGDAVFWPVLRQ
jgi:hypothetical protein